MKTTVVRYLSVLMLAVAFVSHGYATPQTSLILQSEPGDYIGQGQTKTFDSQDGTFTTFMNFDNGVSVLFFGNAGEFWFLDFAAPNNQLLQVGDYEGATRFPFQALSEPGLSISGEGRGCNTLTGSFEVLKVAYQGNQVTEFAATFEQHCEGATPALFGFIGEPPSTTNVPEPATLLLFGPVLALLPLVRRRFVKK